MALERYGVLIGTLQDHARDQPDTQGRWYHVNLRVTAPLGLYRCAVDVDSKQSATGLEGILAPGRRILVFGEPFSQGLGMHNIHQNQGDPAGSQWWDENAIWQDGATVMERPGGTFDVFISKFSTQSTQTDDDGHPV